jgi:lipopolysaccharide export system protein LptC
MSQLADIERNKRQAFAAPGGSFDRLIGVLRVALPAGVGALAAILIISPATDRNEFSFLLDRNTVEKSPERLKVESALYRGQDKDGFPFTLRGESAIQKTSSVQVVELSGLLASFSIKGKPAEVSAQRGAFDMRANTVRVRGPMQFSSDSGYALTANDVSLDLETKTLTSNGRVDGSDADSSLSAGAATGDWDAQKFGLSGGVSGRLPFGTYSAAMLAVDLTKEQARLSGGVSGTTRFGTYRADNVFADQKSGDVVLSGNARLRINGNALR